MSRTRKAFWTAVVAIGLGAAAALGLTPPNNSVDYGHQTVQVQP